MKMEKVGERYAGESSQVKLPPPRALALLAFGGLLAGCGGTADEGSAGEAVGVAEEAVTCLTIVRPPSGGVVQDATIAVDYANPSRADTNFGTLSVNSVGEQGTTSRATLVQFDLSALTALGANVPVTFAKLDLVQAVQQGAGAAQIFRVTAPWSEATVTWNNFGNGFDNLPIAGFTPSAFPLGATISTDVTAAVQAWASGSKANHGFLLFQTASGRTSFGASEAAPPSLRPSLTVCFVAPTCADGLQNGYEVDVDCGGSCGPCAAGQGCTTGSDCQSLSCVAGTCQAATCGDGVMNGNETGVDCGGACAVPETCNGLDDDCNGLVDEGNPGGGGACTTGQPGACSAGVSACANGGLVCIPNAAPSAEVCDGVDNDCDGAVDEGNPGGGAACNTGAAGVCSAGTVACSGGALVCSPTVLAIPEVCDGVDNDCDGVVDDGVAFSGTLASWSADNSALDDVGSNHGTLFGGAGFTQGLIAQAFGYDGVDDYGTFGTTLGNFGTADFSFEFWLSTKSTRLEGLIGKRAACGHASFVDVRVNAGRVKVELDQNGANFNSFNANAIINDGAWHHVAVVRQGKALSLYIDGDLDTSKSTSGISSISNSAAFSLGTSACVGSDGTQLFTGNLDEVHVYGRALSPNEVDQIFSSGSSGICVSP